MGATRTRSPGSPLGGAGGKTSLIWRRYNREATVGISGGSNGINRPDHLCHQFRSASQHEVRLPLESPDDAQAKETRPDPNTDDDARNGRLLKLSRKGPIQKSRPECTG